MDILLTHGYFLDEDPHERAVMKPYPPLGILYLSSHLKSKGFQVGVFDTTFGSRDDFRSRLEIEKPPVVGLYSNMLTRRSVLKMIRICHDAGARVILGGPDPANYPEEYLARGANVVVIGEGEETLEELLSHLDRLGMEQLERIKGIAYRAANGAVTYTPPRPYLADLDAQPLPDRAAIDVDRYLQAWRSRHGHGSLSLLTARGCSYRCAWCSHAVFGYSHRRRSPRHVADELESMLSTYHPDVVWYADDVFTLHRPWLLGYAEELKNRGIRVPFETTSREDRLDEEAIRILAEMGCFRLWLGVESGSPWVLREMDRRTNPTRAREMVRLLQKHGIEAGVFIMLGYEREETDDLSATVEFLKGAAPDHFLTTLAYPVKGTPYYQRVADRIIPLKGWEEGSDRDNTVAGRHSRRFYQMATRWMVGEVNWSQQRRSPKSHYLKAARAFLSAKAGQLGMLLTQREVERGQ